MRILAIETSCDDTSIALVEASSLSVYKKSNGVPSFTVIEQIISSQTHIHRHWGGVVPNLAKREHLKNLPKIWKRIVNLVGRKKGSGHRRLVKALRIDTIVVTVGPGLEPALWTGIEFAKKLGEELDIPIVGANHLEGHLYSFLLPQKTVSTKREARSTKKEIGFEFPVIALLVSGGHTMLLLMNNLLHWEKLGETRDDAVGEAFDKVARMLELPYPGGPEIEKIARTGNPKAINFPRPMMKEKNFDFSFSGLKTAVLYYIKEHVNVGKVMKRENASSTVLQVKDVAASFQAAAIDVLSTKTLRAVREYGARSVALCGGVAANLALRTAIADVAAKAGAQFYVPAFEYSTDNAAMIAVGAYMHLLRKKKKLPLVADGTMSL